MERRRIQRIGASFLLRVCGVDAAPVLRRGDVSPGGIYFETLMDPGPVGSVQTLSVASEDGIFEVSLLAQLVRRVSTQDLWKGDQFVGAAFRFMPESGERQRHLDVLLQHLLAVAVGRTVVPPPVAHKGTVVRASGLLVLDADWGFTVGEPVRITLEAAHTVHRVVLEAAVATSAPMLVDGAALVRTTLRLGALGGKGQTPLAGASMHEAMDALMDRVELEPDAQPQQQERMSGVVSVVSLPGLVSFLEIQRMNGVLNITRANVRAFIHVRDGKMVDVELGGVPAPDPGQAVIEVLTWQDGVFEFVRDDHPKLDRIGRATMELLLEAARMQDEQRHRESLMTLPG